MKIFRNSLPTLPKLPALPAFPNFTKRRTALEKKAKAFAKSAVKSASKAKPQNAKVILAASAGAIMVVAAVRSLTKPSGADSIAKVSVSKPNAAIEYLSFKVQGIRKNPPTKKVASQAKAVKSRIGKIQIKKG